MTMETTWTLERFLEEAKKKVKAYNNYWNKAMKNIDSECRLQSFLGSDKTIAEMILAANTSKSYVSDNTSATSTFSKKRSFSCIMEDEGYITEESHNKRPAPLNTHVSFSNKTLNASRKFDKSRFKTPCKGMKNKRMYNPVTPKVAPNKTLTMMRRPVQGEMALSLAGSPLLVSNMGNEEFANVNIPMGNGRIVSLLPCLGGLNEDDIPQFDPDTKRQLLMLSENLKKIVQMSSSNAKKN